MTRVLYALLPLLGGAMIAVQAPVNARLRSVLASPVGSATVSFATGLVILLAAVVIVGDVENLGSVGGGPWWAYLGGALGASSSSPRSWRRRGWASPPRSSPSCWGRWPPRP